MPEQPTDSGSANSGVGTPNPLSGSQNAQPNSFDADKFAESLLAKLDPILDRKLQSLKDRRFDQQDKRLAEVEKLAGELKSTGMSPQASQILAERLTPTEPKPSDPASGKKDAGNVPTPTDEERSVLATAGLKEDDPDVIAIQQANPDENSRLAGYMKLLARKNAPANPAAALPMRGATPSGDLQARYQSELKNIRRGDVESVARLKAKYRKEGLPV
jgi:hypothetical protein